MSSANVIPSAPNTLKRFRLKKKCPTCRQNSAMRLNTTDRYQKNINGHTP